MICLHCGQQLRSRRGRYVHPRGGPTIQVEAAAREWLARFTGKRRPEGFGWWTTEGYWLAEATEHRVCCNRIMPPSRRRPLRRLYHCMTIRHIAHLFHVPEAELRRAVRAHRASLARTPEPYETDEKGTIYGYKYLVRGEQGMFYSPLTLVTWSGDSVVADRRPSRWNGNGIYAAKRPDDPALASYATYRHAVLVKVALSGTVIETERGFRAERARIVEVLR